MKEYARKVSRLALVLALVVGLLPVQVQPAQAVSTPKVVISQVYGGGGNSTGVYKNDFIELFNPGPDSVTLDGWSVQYGSATGNLGIGGTPPTTDPYITPLSGTLAAGQYLLIQEAAGNDTTQAALPEPDLTDTTPIAMSGTGAKVAVVNTTTSLSCGATGTSANPCVGDKLAAIVDLVGWGTTTSWFEGATAPATTNSTAILRKGDGCTDTNNNSADFNAGTPSPRNASSATTTCPTSIPPSGAGSASPSSVEIGDSTLLTVVVTPGTEPGSTGLGVTCDLSPIGGASSVAFTDNGSNSFSYNATVAQGTTGGAKTLTCSVTDAQGRSGAASIALTVIAPVSIGSVNGVVADTENGATHVSPVKGQSVIIQGVIYEKTIQATSTTPSYGFFIQNTAATADTDPKTSDGLFVFMNKATTMSGPTTTYTPTVGDEVVLSGTVSEYYNFTELTNPTLFDPVVRSNVDLDDELAPVVVNPPASLADANRYWERLQGMRLQVPANSIVLNGRGVFNPADAETWLASPESEIARRTDPYTRRAFRDSHPLDDNYDSANWDGNGYRIVIGSMGIKAQDGDPQALLAPSRTFDTLQAPVVGGLNYTYSKYRIEVTSQPEYTSGADPALNNPPQTIDRSIDYSIVDYNLENLYDYRNNPFSGCDFSGDTGCPKVDPFLSAVNSPYDYVPVSDAAYQARLTDIAKQIINVLHSPDILMVQEVENQDFCSVADGSLVCGASDNADGKPDVLQDLALKIKELGGPAYDSAFDRDSSDLRGIAPSFLFRTDRVELLPSTGDPVLGADPLASASPVFEYPGATVPGNAQTINPKTLNAVLPATFKASDRCETAWVFPRAADVALFRIYSTSIGVGSQRDVYVINNHFKSTPDSCVAHRTEQARLNAAIIKFIQAAKPGARIVMGGDLNVYARPDDTTPKTDQLASLYDETIGLKNLIEVLVDRAPEAAYSYVYMGMAQTIDQMYVNQAMLAGLQSFNIAHINSDFAAEFPTDEARGTSDHDPSVAVFSFTDSQLPTVDGGGPYTVASGASVALSATGTDPEGGALTYAWDLDNNGSFETPGQNVTFSALTLAEPVAHTVKVRVTNTTGLTQVAEATVTVTNQAPVLAEPTSKEIPENAAYSFTASATDPNAPPQTLSYSLVTPPVNNAAINTTTGEFTWTPTEEQGGSPYTFTIEVSDGYDTAQKTFTLTVIKTNQAPVFATLADQSVTAPAALSFTISATDADLPAQTLTYAVKTGTLPNGATFDPAKRAFNWTPTYLQAGTYPVIFTVSDGIAPAVEMTITITVDKGSLILLPIIANH